MMSRIFSFFCIFFFSFAFANTGSFAQSNRDTLAPFQKNKKLPSFTIRLLDSITLFNTQSIAKGKQTIFILFSPDCDHCAALAKEIKNKASYFDSVNLYMVSPPMSFFEVKKFSYITGIAHMPNVVVGIDKDFFFGSYFHASTVPFAVIYDKNKKLKKLFKSVSKLDDLLLD